MYTEFAKKNCFSPTLQFSFYPLEKQIRLLNSQNFLSKISQHSFGDKRKNRVTMNFMDTELIHYNDEVSRIPTLCVLLYLYLGMAWGRRKRKLMFLSLKLIPSQPFTSGLFLSPEDIVIAFFFSGIVADISVNRRWQTCIE